MLCHQVPHSIQQWDHIFPSLPFANERPVEGLLVALHVLYQIQLQVRYGFPSFISPYLGGASIFLLVYLSLLLPFVLFPSVFGFSQDLMVHPCRLLRFCLSSCSLRWAVLELEGDNPCKLINSSGSLFSAGLFPMGFFQADSWTGQILPSYISDPWSCYLLLSHQILNSTISWWWSFKAAQWYGDTQVLLRILDIMRTSSKVVVILRVLVLYKDFSNQHSLSLCRISSN